MNGSTTVPWIGRAEFELWSRRGWRVGVTEIVVRRDVVEIWARRPLGTFHRSGLKAWLHRRHDRPLAADDVVREIVRGLVAVVCSQQYRPWQHGNVPAHGPYRDRCPGGARPPAKPRWTRQART
jgi:hypothetical protein